MWVFEKRQRPGGHVFEVRILARETQRLSLYLQQVHDGAAVTWPGLCPPLRAVLRPPQI